MDLSSTGKPLRAFLSTTTNQGAQPLGTSGPSFVQVSMGLAIQQQQEVGGRRVDNGVAAQCLQPLHPASLATGFFLYPGTKKERDPQRERHK